MPATGSSGAGRVVEYYLARFLIVVIGVVIGLIAGAIVALYLGWFVLNIC